MDKMRQKEMALALIQMAWADRRFAPEEETMVANLLARIGLEPEEIGQMQHKAEMAKLESVLPNHNSRLDAMRMLLAVAFSDRVLMADELDYILKMAERLGITPPELEELRQQVVREN